MVEKHGPLLSSALRARLTKTGLSEEGARKRISRALASGEITRVQVNFPHNDHLLHTQEQFNSEHYWDRLRDAFDKTKSVYGLCLSSVAGRGGGVRQPLFETFSGSPIKQRGHLASSAVLSKLMALRVLQQAGFDAASNMVTLGVSYGGPSADSHLLAVETAEAILLSQLREWVKRLGLGSFGRVEVRNLTSPPRFAQFRWDLVGPSYVHPLVRKDGSKVVPGFIVADVNLAGDITKSSAAYFVNKCRVTRVVNTYPRFMALLVGHRFSPAAIQSLRQDGVVAATVDNLFGKEIAESLAQLIGVLENAAKAVTQDPGKVFELINKLSKIEGAATNLRGALFEMICAYTVKRMGGFSVEIGVRVPATSGMGPTEMDVLGTIGNAGFFVCECKGYPARSTLPNSEITKWTSRLAAFRAHLQARFPKYSQMKKTFELWTPARIDAQGIALLKAAKAAGKGKYELDWKNGASLRAHVQKANEKSVFDTLLQHFF